MSKSIFSRSLGDLPPEKVIALVARYYATTVEDIHSQSRANKISSIRQVAMWALYLYSGLTYKQIGKMLGRDHATIRYGVTRAQSNLSAIEGLKKLLDKRNLDAEIHSPSPLEFDPVIKNIKVPDLILPSQLSPEKTINKIADAFVIQPSKITGMYKTKSLEILKIRQLAAFALRRFNSLEYSMILKLIPSFIDCDLIKSAIKDTEMSLDSGQMSELQSLVLSNNYRGK